MTETNSTQAEERPRRLLASEITPGLPVWAPIFKKRADIPATIISAEAAQDGGMLCQLLLEIEDPFSNQIIRQVHKKLIHSDQLTHRRLPEPAAQQTSALSNSTPESDPIEEPEQPAGKSARHRLGDADRANRDLRYHIDEGERAFTRLAVRLAEVEAYHPRLSHLKDEAASFRDRYRRVLYGESAAQATEGEPPNEQQEAEQAPPEEPQPETEAAIWTRYSQDDLRRYDDQRRAWLTTWAAAHNYPALSYRSHWRGKGYLTFSVPDGRKAWTNFLTHAWRYLAYCAFVEAYAPGQIEHYLGEAAQRGDIHLDQNAQTLMPESETNAEDQVLDPASLTFFAQEHSYRDFWFTLHGRYSGYSRAGVPKGEEAWTHFLKQAVQYDIYCAFVGAYAPGQLERLLTDAAARGEIKLGSELVWTPSKQQTLR